jgi:hypothetical protein
MSSHSGADLSKLDEFKIVKNQTTEKELVEHFGAPGNSVTRGDGIRVPVWNDGRSNGHFNVAEGLPIVGMAFMGKGGGETTVTNRSLTATVRDGVVTDYTVSDGNQKMPL